MKKTIILITVVFAATFSLTAQEPENVPTAPATPVVRDDDIRLRSIELERVKRDAAKNNEGQNDPATSSINKEIDKKYPEIKEDFEGMQLSQAAIIKAYTTGDKIDYAMIEASADQINKNAERLNSNLFEAKLESKSDDEEEKEAKSIRNIIVELDNAIGDVATSKMFLNLRVVDPEIAQKTQEDLAKVLMLSTELSEAARKLK